MKATGIVRRIDDLGRVVIPKEIRRTLRIREGDPLEIFTDRDGGVVLKKYSPIMELSKFSQEYVEALNQTTGHIVIVTDSDGVIAVAGISKKEYLEKKISDDLDEQLGVRKTYNLRTAGRGIAIYEGEDISEVKDQIISPIIAGGDIVGSIILISKDEDSNFTDVEVRLTETAAVFLGKQMEQ